MIVLNLVVELLVTELCRLNWSDYICQEVQISSIRNLCFWSLAKTSKVMNFRSLSDLVVSADCNATSLTFSFNLDSSRLTLFTHACDIIQLTWLVRLLITIFLSFFLNVLAWKLTFDHDRSSSTFNACFSSVLTLSNSSFVNSKIFIINLFLIFFCSLAYQSDVDWFDCTTREKELSVILSLCHRRRKARF